MNLDRRALLAGLSASLVAPRLARAAIDGAGRSISVSEKVARVLPAEPAAAILLYTLAPELLLGWPRANRAAECEFMRPDICRRPGIGRLTGRGDTAHLDDVRALKPDLIVEVGGVRESHVARADRVQRQTGIPYALFDGRLAALPESYRKLGALVGRVDAARRLANYAVDTMETMTRRIATVPAAERPRVYYARGPRGLVTGLGGSVNVETIAFLGARNVAGGTQGGLAGVSIEQVLVWNPEVIVTVDRTFVENVRRDPAWAAVEAVRKGRVHLSPTLPFGWVDVPPSANRLIGLWWLAKRLYPRLFPEDLKALTHAFYRRFYHVDLSDTQIARALEGGR